MKTAIFGGTFDPIHSAHLRVAHEAADFMKLERIVFVPAGNPPHKHAGTPFDDRFHMLELACAEDARFEVSRIEEGNAKSYSIHTIERLKRPGEFLYFIIGADAFSELETWHRWKEVIQAVEFIVAARPGHVIAAPVGARIYRLETLAMDVSSSEIRHRILRGEMPADVPVKVAEYIRAHGLYHDQ